MSDMSICIFMHVCDLQITTIYGFCKTLQHVRINFISIEIRTMQNAFDKLESNHVLGCR